MPHVGRDWAADVGAGELGLRGESEERNEGAGEAAGDDVALTDAAAAGV